MASAANRSILRAIDANANRCREGLRVAEDFARFVLDDARTVGQLKSLRHDVTDAVKLLTDEGALIEARDTEGDVGTHISVPQETRRAAEEDILKSALKRAEEALRVLEEFGKMVRPDVALRFEVLRYRLYTIEQELLTARLPERKVETARLCVIVNDDDVKGGLEAAVRGALQGGADIVVYRGDALSDGKFLEHAHILRALCGGKGVPFIVRARADIAAAVEADGVQLPEDGLSVEAARKVMGKNRIVGYEASKAEVLKTAVTMKVQYAVVAGRSLKHAPEGVPLPLFVMVDSQEAAEKAVHAGAKRLAAAAVVTSATDPATAAADIKGLLKT